MYVYFLRCYVLILQKGMVGHIYKIIDGLLETDLRTPIGYFFSCQNKYILCQK